MSSSLSSVVSNLVRAQMGASVTNTTDEDLDRHVAELLVKDAKKRAERYSQTGIRAYITNQADTNAPKANKRFLTSIIRSTDEHNKTILKAQALSAQEIQREKEEALRKQRRERAEEAVAAERLRRSGDDRGRRRRRHSSETSDSWDHWDGRTADRKRKQRDWETWDGVGSDERRPSRRHRHRDDSRRHSRSAERRDEERSHHRSSRRTRRSASPDDDRHRRHRSSRHKSDDDKPHKSRTDSTLQHRSRHNRSKRERSASPKARGDGKVRDVDSKEAKQKKENDKPQSKSPTPPPPKRQRARSPSVESSFSSRMSISPSPSPGPEPPVQRPSKMDKYFEESYDPRLDVAPLSAPKVPATGLINNAEFEGWDAMLDLIRARREDKVEKKRLEKMGLSKDQIKKEMSSVGAVADRWNTGGASVMDIEYKKKGSVREWDLGKEVT